MRGVTAILCLALSAIAVALASTGAAGQMPIPYRMDGYPVTESAFGQAPIAIDCFVDLLCPDCAEAWPVLLQVGEYYGTNVSIVMHLFPLPYHTHGFLVAQAAEVAMDQMKFAPKYNIELLTSLFANQQAFWNPATMEMTGTQVLALLRKTMLASTYIDGPTFDAGMASDIINMNTRVSWKYGCSRGVTGTPTFFVNGVTVNADPSWSLAEWRQVLDPLLAPQTPDVAARAPVVPVPRVILREDAMVGEPKAVPGTPAGDFPYKFPYNAGRHIVADFALQKMRLYDGARVLAEFPMSSGKLGIGFKTDSPASPSGKFRVAIKVGRGQPMYTIIEKLTPTGVLGKETDVLAHMQTRILVLEGVDRTPQYDNTNTRARSIYIHGTNKEKLLGTRQSHGCFRIGNQAVWDLFEAVQTGTEFYAVPIHAWPN